MAGSQVYFTKEIGTCIITCRLCLMVICGEWWMMGYGLWLWMVDDGLCAMVYGWWMIDGVDV